MFMCERQKRARVFYYIILYAMRFVVLCHGVHGFFFGLLNELLASHFFCFPNKIAEGVASIKTFDGTFHV
jgi:hypothetical protein